MGILLSIGLLWSALCFARLFPYFIFPLETNSYLSFPAGGREWPNGVSGPDGHCKKFPAAPVSETSPFWGFVWYIQEHFVWEKIAQGFFAGMNYLQPGFLGLVFLSVSAETTKIKAQLCHFCSPQGYLAPVVLLLVQFGCGDVHWTDDLQEEIYWSVTGGTGHSSVPEK